MSNDPETYPLDPSEEKAVPPPALPGPLQRPLDLGTLDKPVDLAAWRAFFSLTGGSILYCLSAMCVIYGFAAILGPVFARSFFLGETLSAIVGLNVYEIALVAVLLLIVVRHNVTDDAISLVVLSGVFLVVTGFALTTTSNSDPRAVLLIGVCCFALAMGKVFVLRRLIGMSISPLLWGGLAVVLGWNFLAGARLAEFAASKDVGREQWLTSWLVLLAGAAVVLLDAALRRPMPPEASGARVPFLRRPAMSWIFSLVLLAAAGVHEGALAYVFRVPCGLIDFLPIVCILSLILVQLALHLRARHEWLTAALAAIPLVAFACVLAQGRVIDKPAPDTALLWHPAVFLALTGAAVLLTGLRWRSRALLAAAPFYALGVILTLRFAAAGPADLHWYLAGALVVLGLFALGLAQRSEAICVAAVWLGTAGFAATAAFDGFAGYLGLSALGAVLGLAGVGTLAVALVFGRMAPALVAAAAVAVMICAFDFFPAELGWRDLFAALALVALGAGLYLRVRHWPSIVILCVPLAFRLAVASARLASWRYVVLGFALLAAGAWVSIRKGRKREASGGKASPTDAAIVS